MMVKHNAGRPRAYSAFGKTLVSERPDIIHMKKNIVASNEDKWATISMKTSSSSSCDSEPIINTRKERKPFHERFKHKLKTFIHYDHDSIKEGINKNNNNSSSDSLQPPINGEVAPLNRNLQLDRQTNFSYVGDFKEKHVTFLHDDEQLFSSYEDLNRTRRISSPHSQMKIHNSTKHYNDDKHSKNGGFCELFLEKSINEVFTLHKDEFHKVFTLHKLDQTELDRSCNEMAEKTNKIKSSFNSTNEKINRLNHHFSEMITNSKNEYDITISFEESFNEKMELLKAGLDEIRFDEKKTKDPLLMKPVIFVQFIGCCVFSLLNIFVKNIYESFKQYRCT